MQDVFDEISKGESAFLLCRKACRNSYIPRFQHHFLHYPERNVIRHLKWKDFPINKIFIQHSLFDGSDWPLHINTEKVEREKNIRSRINIHWHGWSLEESG